MIREGRGRRKRILTETLVGKRRRGRRQDKTSVGRGRRLRRRGGKLYEEETSDDEKSCWEETSSGQLVSALGTKITLACKRLLDFERQCKVLEDTLALNVG